MREPGHRGPGPAWTGFCQNLRCAIRRRRIEMRDLSVRTGIGSRKLRRLLAGDVAPHIDDIAQLARTLQVDPGILTFGRVEP